MGGSEHDVAPCCCHLRVLPPSNSTISRCIKYKNGRLIIFSGGQFQAVSGGALGLGQPIEGGEYRGAGEDAAMAEATGAHQPGAAILRRA